MRLWSSLSAEERQATLAEARRLIGTTPFDRINWKALVRRVGISSPPSSIRRHIDRDWARIENKRHAASRRRRGLVGPRADRPPAVAPHRVPPDEIAARLAEIPKDTRSITGYLMGDPVFPRSALAKKQGGAGHAV